MSESAEVNSGNTAIADDYNALRKDALDTTGGHTHDITFPDNGAQVSHANLALKGTYTHAQIDAHMGYNSFNSVANPMICTGVAIVPGPWNLIGIGGGGGECHLDNISIVVPLSRRYKAIPHFFITCSQAAVPSNIRGIGNVASGFTGVTFDLWNAQNINTNGQQVSPTIWWTMIGEEKIS